MHPNTFLQTFWRLELKPQVFVAMSFAPQYQDRFDRVIAPAIRSITVDGESLQPYRVDLSRSGDSILTEINDGIAHSRLILADVSSMGKDSVSGQSYRNGNVLYEVGIALACRQPHEVLLIRDDNDKFLFDVSTIPHKHLNFADQAQAKQDLTVELLGRLQEASYLNDARVQRAISGLTNGEIKLLKRMISLGPDGAVGQEKEHLLFVVPIKGLLDKQLIRVIGFFDGGFPGYQATPFGHNVCDFLESSGLPTIMQKRK